MNPEDIIGILFILTHKFFKYYINLLIYICISKKYRINYFTQLINYELIIGKDGKLKIQNDEKSLSLA